MDVELYKRLRWRCHRGMLELDLFLLRFLDARIDVLTEQDIDQLTELLQRDDPEILSWLTGQQQPDDKGLAAIVKKIQKFHRSQS